MELRGKYVQFMYSYMDSSWMVWDRLRLGMLALG